MPNYLQLSIREACHENWDHMSPSEQGRYCASCKKTVTDFTWMSDRQVLDFLANAGSNACGRFTSEQLNRNIRYAENKKQVNWKYIWNLIVTTSLLTVSANAQNRGNSYKSPVQNSPLRSSGLRENAFSKEEPVPDGQLSGVVLDKSTNNPIPFATIRQKGTPFSSAADSLGRYTIPVISGPDLTLEISSIGYLKQESEIKDINVRSVVEMEPDVNLLQNVVIKGYGDRCVRTSLGGYSSVRVTTFAGKMTREIKSWLPDKYIRAYPNPVASGQSLKVQLSLEKEGPYTMQLIAADGRIVHAVSLKLQDKTQTIELPVNTGWGKGVFWVYINSGNGKKVYQTKVIIQ